MWFQLNLYLTYVLDQTGLFYCSSHARNTSFVKAEGALATIFGELTVAQTLKQTSRVAIVLFSSYATVYADLSKYNDVSELMTDLFAIPFRGDDSVNLLA